jgi:hypothetical protein
MFILRGQLDLRQAGQVRFIGRESIQYARRKKGSGAA